MPVYWRHTYHLVWATHNREPLISPHLEVLLYQHLADKARELECDLWAVNGMPDHLHLVLSIPPSLSVSDAVGALKGASSRFLNQAAGDRAPAFAWQRGFGSITVSEDNRARAVAYVENQKQHHAEKGTFPSLERCGDEE